MVKRDTIGAIFCIIILLSITITIVCAINNVDYLGIFIIILIVLVIIGCMGCQIFEKETDEQKVAENERGYKEIQEKESQVKLQLKKKIIEDLISKGFKEIKIPLNSEDYTLEFLNIMKNWQNPDFNKIPLGSNKLLTLAEVEIMSLLIDYSKVEARYISGAADIYSEWYALLLKVGKYSPNDPLLWKYSYLIIGEYIYSKTAHTIVSWVNNLGEYTQIREILERPLKLKEKFFEKFFDTVIRV
ncbi:MAG: hypothetical protein ACTSVV_07960 [Promethearchaeota archaeon]